MCYCGLRNMVAPVWADLTKHLSNNYVRTQIAKLKAYGGTGGRGSSESVQLARHDDDVSVITNSSYPNKSSMK